MTTPTRILLIEDDAEFENLMVAVFNSRKEKYHVIGAKTLSDGIAAARCLPLDLILLDLQLPDSSGYETFLRFHEAAPDIPLVIVTGTDDQRVADEAVEHGAEDYLVKSTLSPDLITRNVRSVLARRKRRSPPTLPANNQRSAVFAFVGSKGGVGTSTLALNVAALLSRSAATLLIECSEGPPSSSLYTPTNANQGLESLLATSTTAITPQALRELAFEAARNLWLLYPVGCASPRIDAERATAMVSAAKEAFPNVILDLPPHLHPGVIAALHTADSISLVLDAETASIHCAATMMQAITAAACPGKTALVVVERSAPEALIAAPEIEIRLKAHPLATIPVSTGDIASSHAAATPLLILHPHADYSKAIAKLAEHLLAIPAPQHHDPLRQLIPENVYG